MKDKKDIKFEQPSDILIFINRYIMFFVAMIILSVSLLGYFFLLKPKIDQIRSVEQETTETSERKMQNEALIIKLKELENEYKDILQNRQADLDYLKEMVPEGTRIAELFVIADRLAASHNFQLLSIEVSENNMENISGNQNFEDDIDIPNTQEPATDASADIKTIEDILLQSGIKSMVVHMSIMRQIENTDENGEPLELEGVEQESGGQIYNDFKAYISDLENYVRLMDIQAINFPELSFETTESQVFNLDIITYYQ
ncbi:hypothetical protein KKH39_02450 [Patescibacteria group bacterium]|nr:hypothetical protein [Patescibacteria group bacterium]